MGSPLQDTSQAIGSEPRNDACPKDCIQMQSLECNNLMCVATEVPGNIMNMNGECGTAHKSPDQCPNANFGCIGYCTAECLSDASCPKDYKCSSLAPFDINCDNPSQCTNYCTTQNCPSTADESCEQEQNAKCCVCICDTFCPLLHRKFCLRNGWDDKTFPNAKTNAASCGQQTE